MGHEEVVLEWFPVEAPRLAAPAAPRARLARLAGLAVPPTRGRRFEEPEHLRARDGFERARRRPARGHDAEDATRLGAVGGRRGEGREAHQRAAAACGSQGLSGEFHFILMSRQA